MIISLKSFNLFKSLTKRIENGKLRIYTTIDFILESAFKGGIFGLVIATLVWISIFSYIVFYYFYVPSLSYTRPVHLHFTACEAEKGACSFPSAHVELTKKQQLLMFGQKYKIYLNLEMPESPANVDLGMFMVCARMVDTNGILVSNSCRSTMLHFRSPFLKFILICTNLPFFILGSGEEKQTLLVELYSDFEEHPSHPVTDVYIEVESRFIELYSASMVIEAHLSGLRYFMYHWPLVSAVLGISSTLFVMTFIFSLSWYHLYLRHEYGRNSLVACFKRALNVKRLKMYSRSGYIEEVRLADPDSSSVELENPGKEITGEGSSVDTDYFLDTDES